MNFTAGSKTFLVGEYNVLFGGSCVVLITHPEFSLSLTAGAKSIRGIPKSSPGYRFYENHADVFKNFSINFNDPHFCAGGFGASSAQYALLYKAYLKISENEFSIEKFLDEYHKLAEPNQKVLPSGADCLAQFFNHSIYYNSAKKIVEKIDFNFSNIAFRIFKTKTKVRTHEHLRELSNIDTTNLSKFSDLVYKSILTSNEQSFCENLQEFFQELQKLNLVCAETSFMVSQILQIPGVRAAKGCGARSADTILVVVDKNYEEQVTEKVREIV